VWVGALGTLAVLLLLITCGWNRNLLIILRIIVSQIQLVNVHKLHLVNKIIHSQFMFGSILIIVSNTMGMAHLKIKNS
jgi:hypothetical protein